jgi:probable HAF family extracellular repeat protein
MSAYLLKNLSKGIASALLIASGSFMSATDAAPRFPYTVTDLGSGIASDINDVGQVVGWSYPTGAWGANGFLWQNGVKTNIASICQPYPSPPRINNAGQIIGNCSGAVLWNNGTTTKLGIDIAYDINDAGKVVGMSKSHSVVWDSGKITDLGTLGILPSNAQGINNRGQIVGVSRMNTDEQHTFLWQNGTMSNLGKLFFISPSAGIRINNKKQIAGTGIGQRGFRALLWQNGSVTDLGTLGGSQSQVYDINWAGTVVGSSYTSSNVSHAFVWYDGRMRDLNSLVPPKSGWQLTQAYGINNKGQIVGYGKHNGQDRAFLLTPRWISQ